MKPFMPKSLMLRPGSGSFFRYRILEGSVKTNEAAIPEGNEVDGSAGLDKSFGFSKHFGNKFELGDEIGRGYKCRAKFKKGELKVIPKAKTINFFKLGPKLSLVDLPGYGFAYAKEEVIKLGKTL